MNAPSIDIKDILEDSSSEIFYGENLFIGNEPGEPKDCITIFDTTAGAPLLTLDAETGYEYPNIQIRVRNIDYEIGWKLIDDIKDMLHGRHQETWNSTLYSVIACMSGPALLNKDENGIYRFIINFSIQRRAV